MPLYLQIPDIDWLVEKIQGFVDSGVLKGRFDNIWVNPGRCLGQVQLPVCCSCSALCWRGSLYIAKSPLVLTTHVHCTKCAVTVTDHT